MKKLLTWLVLCCFLVVNSISYAASDDIARLYNFTAGTTIQSSQVNAEINQIISSMNGKFGRSVANTLSGNNTFSGTNTFSTTAIFNNGTLGLKADTIGEYTSTTGVTIDGVLHKDGYIRPTLSSDPTTVEGNIWYNSTSHVAKLYDGTATRTIATTANIPPILQGYLSGYTLSNDGSNPNTDIDVAAGVAADSTAVDYISGSAIVKRVSTSWAVGTGNGCLDTGAIPTSGTVHIFAIKRTDTNVSDILCSTSTSPTMPANYTEKRRIGSIRTDSSAHIIPFKQYGDRFEYLSVGALDVDVTNQSTTSVSRTLSVPTGIQVEALLHVVITSASQVAVYLQNLDLTDTAPSVTATPLATFVTPNNGGGNPWLGGTARIRTNTSGQIGTRASAASTTLKIGTIGWVDERGRI